MTSSKMKAEFTVEPLQFSVLHELPDAWQPQDYLDLLERMEFDDVHAIPPDELREMCYMSLTDNEPEEAAEIVLGHRFKNRMNTGQIKNASHGMLEERMWEENADLSLHEEFFNVGQLLYDAFDGKFPKPEAIRFKVSVKAKDKMGLSVLETGTETSLIRILVQGMPENTVLHRLFDNQLEGGAFPEAKDIIWQLVSGKAAENNVVFDIISSSYWFRDFKYAIPFKATILMEAPNT